MGAPAAVESTAHVAPLSGRRSRNLPARLSLARERRVKIEALKEWRKLRRRRHVMIAAVAVVLVAVSAAAIVLFVLNRPTAAVGPSKPTRLPAATAAPSPLNLPPPDLLKPVSPEEAIKENSERPFTDRPDTAAAPFKLSTDEKSRDR